MPTVVGSHNSAVLTQWPYFPLDSNLQRARGTGDMHPSGPSEAPVLPPPEGFETSKWLPQGTSVSDQLEESLRVLERLYTLRRDWEIAEFLRAHPSLVDVAIEAPIQIAKHFGLHTRVLLEVMTDPEAGDQQLIASIQTELEAEEALARLDQLDQEWWLEALPKAQSMLCIDLGFA